MLAGTLVIALLLSWSGRRHRLVSSCGDAGWRVCYEYECDEDGHENITIDSANNSVVWPTPHGPELLRKGVGLAYFNQIRGITHIKLNTESDHRLFESLSSQPSITFLCIHDGGLEWRDVKTIAALPNLKLLRIEQAARACLTADEVRRLATLHPECELYIGRMEPPPE